MAEIVFSVVDKHFIIISSYDKCLADNMFMVCTSIYFLFIIKVHASPQRYHAAYIGACTLASLPPFERSCITSEEWNKQGAKTLKKWHMY